MDTFTSLEECVERLAPRELPAMRHTIDTYREMVAQDNDGVVELTNLVLMDPGLLITLFRRAIEVPRKNLHSDITTVDQAMMLLGSSNVGKIIEGSAVLEETLNEPALTHYKQIVSRAYHSAYQAFDLARNRSDVAPDEIFAATMLQETGALVMWLHYPDLMAQYQDDLDEEDERALFHGLTLSELTRALAREWGLSAFIQLTLDPEAREKPRVKSVDLGVRVGWAAEKGWQEQETEELILEIARYIQTSPAEVMEEIRDNAEHAAEETPFYGVEAAIDKLPPEEEAATEEHTKKEAPTEAPAPDAKVQPVPTSAPRPPIEQAKPAAPRPAPVSKQPTRPAPPQEPAQTPLAGQAECPIPTRLLQQQMAQLKEIVLSDHPQLPQLMSATMHALHEGVALNRALFMMLGRDRKTLHSRFVMGTDDPRFKQLAIKMNQHSLFDLMLGKAQSLWLKSENRGKIWPMLPPDFAKLIEVDSFFMMSIKLKGKPVGLFYADRFGNDYGLDQNAYSHFRTISTLAAKGLLKLSR